MLAESQFRPISTFCWEANRAERSHQVRWLAPLLDRPAGRAWFLEQLQCPCTLDEARAADVFHLCFPLRDLFTADYYQCRGIPHLEDQFITYYNHLFGLPKHFGVQDIWRTAPGGEIRHPAAPGRKGWHRDFLTRYLPPEQVDRLVGIRQLLDTEADAMLLLPQHVATIECKYQSSLRREQYERQMGLGELLGKRLGKEFFFGLVVESPRDFRRARVQAPYVTWAEIEERLGEKRTSES